MSSKYDNCNLFFSSAQEYTHGCPGKELGQGSKSDSWYETHFDSTENQPNTMISLGKAPVSCCNDNGECIRQRPIVDRGWFDSIVETVVTGVETGVEAVEEVVENIGYGHQRFGKLHCTTPSYHHMTKIIALHQY